MDKTGISLDRDYPGTRKEHTMEKTYINFPCGCTRDPTSKQMDALSTRSRDNLDPTLMWMIVANALRRIEQGDYPPVLFNAAAARMCMGAKEPPGANRTWIFSCGSRKYLDTITATAEVIRQHYGPNDPNVIFSGTVCIDYPMFNHLQEQGHEVTMCVDGVGVISWIGCMDYEGVAPLRHANALISTLAPFKTSENESSIELFYKALCSPGNVSYGEYTRPLVTPQMAWSCDSPERAARLWRLYMEHGDNAYDFWLHLADALGEFARKGRSADA